MNINFAIQTSYSFCIYESYVPKQSIITLPNTHTSSFFFNLKNFNSLCIQSYGKFVHLLKN